MAQSSSFIGLVLGFLCLVAGPVAAAAQEPFPTVGGKDLAASPATAPACVSGSAALVVVGFTRGSSEACTDWQKSQEQRVDLHGRCRLLGLVELEGAPFFVPGLVRAAMRKRLPAALWGHVLLLREGTVALKEALGFSASAQDDPYLALLDRQGRVVWAYHGVYGPAAESAFTARLKSLGLLP